jgi:G3E family GTPase
VKKLEHIPTNIITGFLGSGKTTLIRHLLKNKPAHERWAVLVNEFGEIGIDASLLNADLLSADSANSNGEQIGGIAVKEVAGGCMCCATGVPSKVALNQLIRSHKPDRILIEPTGLAHPQQVLTLFTSAEYQTLLDVQATLCVVDPWCFTQEKFLELPAFHSQLQLADILICNKTDKASATEQQAFDDYCSQQNKSTAQHKKATAQLIIKTTQGDIDWQLLKTPRQHASQRESHVAGHTPLTDTPATPALPLLVTELVRKHSSSEAGHSGGWLLPRHCQFDQEKLYAWVSQLPVPRLKAVVNTNQGWQLINRMRDTPSIVTLSDSQAQQEQNRLEIISATEQNWEQLEAELLACITKP